MEHLIDKYLKKPEVVKELFQKEVSISLKVDGAAFQISCENNQVTYHKRGGSSKSLGPIIDEYTQLMRKNVNDAINYFEQKKNILNKYKFYAIEMFNNSYILLTVIDNNDNIIDEPNKLKEISKSLDIDCVPILFNGILKQEQIESLISMMTLAPETTNDVYKKYLTDIFGKGEYEKFLNGDEVEGIVLTWNLEDKIQQFKIINPAFKTRHDKEIKDSNEALKKEIEELTDLYKFLYDQLEKYGTYKSDNWIENLNQNFLEIVDKEYNQIKEFDNTIKPKFKDFFTLQENKVSKDIKRLIDKYGDHMKFYYEKYLSLFNKTKKRNFTISKEFQTKVNALIEKLQSKNESLKTYTTFKMNSLKDYIVENKINKMVEESEDKQEEIQVYSSKTNKEIMVKLYANDKESWKKFVGFYNNLNRFNLMKYSRLYVAKKEDDKWIADVNKNYSINDYQPNYRYLYSSQRNYYTYKQVIEMLESGEYIILLSENKHPKR